MKYGMRERLSGAVILIALAVIFVPMLFDEPAPRSERPQPVLTIEQPVDVERRDVPDPQPPASLGQIQSPSALTPRTAEEGEVASVDEPAAAEAPSEATPDETPEEIMAEAAEAVASPESKPAREDADPIAELARAADQRLAESAGRTESESAAPTPAASTGEWAVQVGSFGEPANAERLEAQLGEQGFAVFSRPRDNNLTTVYVGPYDSSEDGERAMGELKERANLQGLLVRVRD